MADFSRFQQIVPSVLAALARGETSALVFLPDEDTADLGEAMAKSLYLLQDGVLDPSLGGRAGCLATNGFNRNHAEAMLAFVQTAVDAEVLARGGALVARAKDQKTGREYGSLPRLYWAHRALAASLLLTEG
jgi:hypothetical protein